MRLMAKWILLPLFIALAGTTARAVEAGDPAKGQLPGAMSAGIVFLASGQMQSGEFATYYLDLDDQYIRREEPSPFITTFVLHSLQFLAPSPAIDQMTRKALAFIRSLKGDNGLWSFNSYLPPDLDDTTCSWIALAAYGDEIPVMTADYLRQFATREGPFVTWVTPLQGRENSTDPVVNANVVYFFGLQDVSLPGTQAYLEQAAMNLSTYRGAYYPSALAFTYMFSRAYADGKVHFKKKSLHSARRYLERTQHMDGTWGNELKSALAITSLINLGEDGESVSRGIQYLVNVQRGDGSWPARAFFTGEPGPHVQSLGSAELTTAVALEALGKYRKRIE